jgi:hypothetical protein
MKQNPLFLLFRALKLWLSDRVHFRKNLESFGFENKGETFTPFRKVVVDPGRDQPELPGTIFQVRFRFKNLSAKANRRLSLIPIPLIVAQPGFRSKTWLLGEKTGDFIGYYEFDTVEMAEAYWDSLPLKMMRKRAAEGSLTHEIRPTSA